MAVDSEENRVGDTDTDTRLLIEEDLAETYSSPYEFVKQYKEAMDIHRKTGLKSSAISSRLEGVPRGRIRTWIEGGKPDILRGIEKARDCGWLDLDYDDEEFRSLNKLVAWVFSGGSISEENYTPIFSVESPKKQNEIEKIFEELDVDFEIIYRDGRGTEAKLKEGVILGRTLSALGAPTGNKAEKNLSLPVYLDNALYQVKRDFAYIYLLNRGQDRGSERGRGVGIAEKRSDEYLGEIADLLREFTDRGKVSISDKNVYIDQTGTEELRKRGALPAAIYKE